MTFYIKKIKKICIFQKNSIYISEVIGNKFIYINDGSHTKLIQHKFNFITKIKSLQQQGKFKKKIRYVWLENSLHKNITFARSLWTIINQKSFYNNIKKNYPIGLSFIESKIDITRDIQEIYYSYCNEFEKILQFKGTIWGRKYILHSNNNYTTIIQEFFSYRVFN
uniref:Ycf21 n=1 Tax=Tolypiocladia glomerulata TaxID=860646 RepID=A0A1Z1MV79_9FLOR|nr:hypothetical protein [Tolypiocladia glomerulata]ARW69685.1 hypothetical protein [Tolypiocladia glomerulata]